MLLGLASLARGQTDNVLTCEGTPLRELIEPSFLKASALRPAGAGLRISCYNVENFTDGQGDDPTRSTETAARQAMLVATNIAEINPDLALFLEIENKKCLQLLNAALPVPYPAGYISHLGTGSSDEQKLNLAVLSRVKLEHVSEIDFGPLKGPGRPTRGMLRVLVDLGGGHKLVIYGLHLKSNWGNRERNIAQRQNALKFMVADAQHLAEVHPGTVWEVLALGDTNVDPEAANFAGDPSFAPLAGFIDLWRGVPLPQRITWARRQGDPTQDFPSVTFDRFFVSPEMIQAPWRVGAPRVLQRGSDTNNIFTLPGEGRHASDHYPIFIDVIAQ